MPKTNYAGATYFGHTGIVENAVGELSELDPSRNIDGSVVDGFESDDREIEDIENTNPSADPTGVTLAEDPERKNEDAPEEEDKREERQPEPQERHEEPEGKEAAKRGTAKSPTSVQHSTGRAKPAAGRSTLKK